ncbi:MAG: phosphoribosylformylglycinamidine synthase II, partial [Chloroflexi bacterium]|nr:phosphoribosylformylglycinamidine synthase II [Chloroflexota bacterium]
APAGARQRGIAIATDGNGRYCHVDPYRGASIAVAEAARNVVCAGAQPVAVTDCLNFGNPERPDVYHQMQAVIQGIAEACDALGTPVISGNVSLYNETGGQPIYPTPVIGMLGILDDVSQHCTMAPAPGDALFLLGSSIEQRLETLAASEYLRLEHGKIGGRLEIDLQLEGRVQRAALAAIRQDLATAAHDCSDGGLAVTLAEMCLAADAGLDAAGAVVGNRLDAALFGEAQSRIVLAIKPERRHDLVGIASSMNVPLEYIGAVTADDRFRFGPIDLPLADLRDAYENGLERALAG